MKNRFFSLFLSFLLLCFAKGESRDNRFLIIPSFAIQKQLSRKELAKQDAVFLRNGQVISGTITTLPPICYDFGKIAFRPEEVSSIAFNETSMQYVTPNGQNFIGPSPHSPFAVVVSSSASLFEKHEETKWVDPQEIDMIVLKQRNRISPLIEEGFFTLFLKGGDRFPVLIDTHQISIAHKGKKEMLPVRHIDEFQIVPEGVVGYLRQEGGVSRPLPLSQLIDDVLTVRLVQNNQRLVIPWDAILKIVGDGGRSVLRTPYFFHSPFAQMILIPSGRFVLESEQSPYRGKLSPKRLTTASDLSDEQLDHLLHQRLQEAKGEETTAMVEVTRFYFDRHKVTNRDYAVFLLQSGYPPPLDWIDGQIPSGKEDRPVVHISYSDAEAFAAWAHKRLPTLEEWEWALREMKRQGQDAIVAEMMELAEWTSTAYQSEEKKAKYRRLKGGSLEAVSSFQYLHEQDSNINTGFRCVKTDS